MSSIRPANETTPIAKIAPGKAYPREDMIDNQPRNGCFLYVVVMTIVDAKPITINDTKKARVTLLIETIINVSRLEVARPLITKLNKTPTGMINPKTMGTAQINIQRTDLPVDKTSGETGSFF